MYKKIDYSNRNVNNNIKRREKNKMIIINKQKNLSAYTNSKNSHFGRILNLRKLKSQNNMTHEKNNSQKLSEKFSTIRKMENNLFIIKNILYLIIIIFCQMIIHLL